MRLLRSILSVAAASTLLFLFSFVAVSAETIDVTITTDDYDTSFTACDDDPDDCSLREAIIQANNNADAEDTINLPAGVYTLTIEGSGESNALTGDLDIKSDITIVGEDKTTTIIDGNETDRIFEISSASGYALSISGVTMRNGTTSGSTEDGAAIYTKQDTIIDDSIFLNNTAEDDGGAVSFSTGTASRTMEITNSYFEGNRSNNRGGSIFTSGENGTITISNSVFTDNTAAEEGGVMRSTMGTVNISNSLFYDNTVEGTNFGGGALMLLEANHTVTINLSHLTVVGNTTNGEGGGLWIESDSDLTVNMRNSIIADNDSADHTQEDCYVGAGSATTNSLGYNIISDSTGCTSFFDHETDLLDEDPLVGSALSERGGEFDVLGFNSISSPAIDMVPAASCLDAEGASLTTDVRGYTRPENTDCDAGAYELDQTSPTVTLDPVNLTLECAVDTYSTPTATVSDNFDTTVTTASEESNNVDEGTAGSYSVVYASTADYDGNIGRGSQPVTVEDTISPVITMNGEIAETVEAGGTYTDDGASASDTCDESVSVNTSGTVDTDTLGAQVLVYSAEDSAENDATTKERTVTVQDTIAPTIAVIGESAVTLTVGDSYTDAGATATDSFEGTLTDDITTSGTVDTDTAGTYTITYNVSDSSGNAATEVTRSVTVVAAEEEEVEEEEPVEEEEGEEEPVEEEETGTDNDVETGEGDGSEDTEETLGAVESLTKTIDSTVTVTYEGGETKTFQLFTGSAKAKVQLHTNGAILIAINKTYMRTFDAFTGEQIDQVKLFKSKQYKTKFKRFNIYKNAPGKNNVMVLAQTKKKHKKQFKLRSFVVKNGGAITKRPYRTIRLTKNANFSKLSINKNKKSGKKARILIKKNGKTLKSWKYKVTKKKGIIKKAN